MNTKEHTEEMDGGERNERDDKKNCNALKLKIAKKNLFVLIFIFHFI